MRDNINNNKKNNFGRKAMREKRHRYSIHSQRHEEIIKICQTVSSLYGEISPEDCLEILYKHLSLYEDKSRLTPQNVIQYILLIS